MKADLHLHSTASDGTLEPGELVALAAELGFTHLALTDHDSVDGLARATDTARDYGQQSRTYSEDVAARIDAEVQRKMNDALARATAILKEHRAQLDGLSDLLVEAGYANSVSSAFDKYLLPGKCGYVPKAEVKVAEAAKLIAGAGGVAVLAHPMELKMGEMTLESLVHEWHGQGLAGIEVYHPSAANNSLPFLLHLAEREGMLVTGGSDFHGPQVRQSCIGDGLDRWTTAEADVQKLLNRIGL